MKKRSLPVAVRLLRTTIQLLGIIAPWMAARWVYYLWFTTPRYPEPRRERRWREQSVQSFLDIDGDLIAVYRWGDETLPRVYLVHGWSGRGPQLGAFIEPLNRAGFAVISFDAVGHGYSSGKSANIVKITSHLHAISRTYGKPSHLIAHSFGCMVAALLIRKYNIQPCSLVTISSPTRAEYLVDIFFRAMKVGMRVRQRFERMLFRDFGENIYHEIAADENLRGNTVPALIIHDKRDEGVEVKYSEKLLDAMPDAQALITDGLGHKLILHDKKIISRVVDFIKDHDC